MGFAQVSRLISGCSCGFGVADDFGKLWSGFDSVTLRHQCQPVGAGGGESVGEMVVGVLVRFLWNFFF